jgi:hypothetical protein
MLKIKMNVVGRPSVVGDDLVQSVAPSRKICERWRFTISELSCEFSNLDEVSVTSHKFCAI